MFLFFIKWVDSRLIYMNFLNEKLFDDLIGIRTIHIDWIKKKAATKLK